MTGSFGVAASAAEADAAVSGESVVVSAQSDLAGDDLIESDLSESDPVESELTEGDPGENETVETGLTDSDHAASDQAEGEPAESDPAEGEPAESDSSNSGSAGKESVESGDTDAPAGEESDPDSPLHEETESNSARNAEEAPTASLAGDDGEGTAEPPEAGAEGETEYEVVVTAIELNRKTVSLQEGKTVKLTATVFYECEDLSALTEKLSGADGEDVTWSSSNAMAASVTADSAMEIRIGEEQEEGPFTGTIAQEVTVSAVGEGSASISASAGGVSDTCEIVVDPLPVVLGTPSNPDWSNTTVLSWDAVENTDTYRITVWLKKGSAKYSKTVDVTGRTNYDLEDEIVSLIKTNRKTLTGAAYTIWATVQARTTDPTRYKNSKAGTSPSFRYLRTTYLEALDRNGWYLRNGNWYYYEEGVMKKGWIAFCGERYYLNKDGILQKNCWISGKYLKSDGAMAKNEWVDNYSCYVGQDGKVVEGTTFSMKNWVQTSAGWRYKTADGKFVKNTWYSLNHRAYYFDAAGHMVTGWLTLDGKTYYLNNAGTIETGKGARQSGWKKIGSSYYWFDKNGVMAKSQWVDRGQYYVNAAGRRQSWISYASLRNVNTSNRLGYDIYSAASPPEQSIASYDLAYQNGNRIMVIDLRFTKDNVPVCFHDDEVKYARWKNGNTPGQSPSVSKLTYEQLSQYDFGIYRGAQYKGTAALTLDAMAAWIKRHPDAELYIEVKADTMSAAQIRNVAAILKQYGITDQSSAIFTVSSASDTRAKRMHSALPSMRIGLTTSQIGTLAYTQLEQVKGSNETFLWCWNTVSLSASIVNNLKSRNILYECGTFTDSLDDILSYYSKGTPYAYNSGVETPSAVFHSLLRNATYHNKAQWVKTDKGWKYQKVDQTFVKNSWLTLGAKKYHFASNGIMQTGWLDLGGTLYYLDSDGSMVTGWKVIASARYYFNADGVMLTGKQVLNGHTYLFDSKGKYIKKIN